MRTSTNKIRAIGYLLRSAAMVAKVFADIAKKGGK